VNWIDHWGLEANDATVNLSQNNITHINRLHPDIRDATTQVLSTLQQQGINVEIYSSLRTIEEQNALYQIGRDEDGNDIEGERRPTQAQGGSSYHNYGLAFDVEIYVTNEAGRTVKDWGFEGSNWQTTIAAMEDAGFTAGYRWPGEQYDPVHFQNSFGFSTNELMNLYNNGNVNNGYVTLP
jgi:peptidoglycan L-alanyl-D-glutamate endopeptidase CwlK